MRGRITALLLCACLMLFPGCSNGQGLAIPDLVRGGYKEELIDFPEFTYIAGFEQISDNAFYVIGTRQTEYMPEDPFELSPYSIFPSPSEVWYSEDGGLHWEQRDYGWLSDTLYISGAAFTPDGGIYFIHAEDPANPDENLHIAYGDSTGWSDIAKLPTGETVNISAGLAVTESGDFLLTNYAAIRQLDRQGELTASYLSQSEYDAGTYLHMGKFAHSGNSLMIGTPWSILCFDLQNGRKVREIPLSIEADLDGMNDAEFALTLSPDSGDLYLCNPKGIYRVTDDGSLTEQLVSGAYYSFGGTERRILHLSRCADGSFLLLTRADTQGAYGLARYALDATVSRVPEREITVYSLYDNPDMRQRIRQYRRNAPDVLVNFRVGVESRQDTVADALNTLSIELRAGLGPDIILLDGIPFNDFARDGYLLPLDTLIEKELAAGELFAGIVTAYASEQGLCAIPAGFSFPVVCEAGTETAASMGVITERFRREGGYGLYVRDVLDWFYLANGNGWSRPDREAVERAAADSLPELESLLRANATHDSYVSMEIPTQSAFYALGEAPFMFGVMERFEDFAFLRTAVLERGEGAIQAFSDTDGDLFIPQCILSINASSGHIDDARDFARYLLSREVQAWMEQGLPVNRLASEDIWRQLEPGSVCQEHYFSYRGQWEALNILWPDEAGFRLLTERIDGLGTPAANDEPLRLFYEEQARPIAERYN